MALNEFKSGIESTKKTAQIANAMRMVSAAVIIRWHKTLALLSMLRKCEMVSYVAKSCWSSRRWVPIRQDGLNYIDFHAYALRASR